MEKPQEILEIEKFYGFELIDSNIKKNDYYTLQKNYYTLKDNKIINLNLSNNGIEDLSPLSELLDLKSLNLSWNNISNIMPLSSLTSLCELNLFSNKLSLIDSISKFSSLNTLDLSMNNISDLNAIIKLTSLKKLALSFNKIIDISQIARLTQLTDLLLQNNKIEDLSPIAELTQLEKLYLQNNNINNLTPLIKLVSLTELFLNNNLIYDITPLNKLQSLENLHLTKNIIEEVSSLINLKKLKTVNLSNNRIQSLLEFEFILKNTNIAFFSASKNPFIEKYGIYGEAENNLKETIKNRLLNNQKSKEILEIEKLYRIKLTQGINANNIEPNQFFLNSDNQVIGLSLSDNQIDDLSPINNLTHLANLVLSRNQIADLSPIKNLTNLNNLDLRNNSITDLSPIKNLTSLTNLYLSYNQIDDLSPIKNLIFLTDLNLRDNQISDLSPIKNLTSLINLDLHTNQIINVSPIKNLTNLIDLDLNSNQIENISPIKNLTSLTNLVLSFNQISDLSPIENLTYLTKLHLSYNKIIDLSPIKKLTNLTELNLHDNKITDLSPIKNLTSLTNLYLSYNQIADLSQFEFIIPLKNLYIIVQENPLIKNYDIRLEKNSNQYDAIVNELLKQEELQQNQTINYILPAKVLLLGNTQNGKSTMLNYLIKKDKSKRIIPSKNSTHILSISTLPRFLKRGELPKAVFYDFGGQDYYHGLYRAFLNNGAISVIFWNSENDKNQIRLDNNNIVTRDFNRDYWVNQLKYSEESENKSKKSDDKNIKTNTVLMVQTHADNGSKRATYNGNCDDMRIENEFFVALNQKAIDSSKIYKTSLDYFETSLNEQISLKQETVKETKWYKELLSYIQQTKGKEPTSLLEIGKHYNRKADNEKRLLPEVLRVLASTGLLLYYKDDDDLKDVAWLDPTATIKNIHDTILSKKQLGTNKGIIKKENFDKNDERIIKLLRNQKVVFLDTEDNNYIIPGYLPLTSEDSKMYDLLVFDLVEPNFVIKFKYFIPFGLINQLICHYGKNPEKKHYWRDQLIFTMYNCKVLIQLDFSNLEVSVSIKSAEAKRSLDQIERKIFEDILGLYYDQIAYRYDEMIDQIIDEENQNSITEVLGENYPKTFENEIKKLKKDYQSPDDMYISVDNKTFVHHKTLEDIEQTSSKITAYGFDERVEIQNNKEITIRTINESKTREQSSGLYKNFTQNENIKSVKKIFISYSRKDVDYKDELKKHLNMLSIFEIADNWSCEEITIGKWDDQIQKELQEADLIIYMLSANFFSSKYILDKEVKVGMDLIDKNKSKNILCVVVSEFVGLDKLKNISENNTKSSPQEALLRLSEHQYLPYDYVENNTTGNREEKIISLKEHSNRNTLESALASITNKVADFCSK